MRTFLKYNIRAILWGVFIIVLTVLPGQVLPGIPVFLDLFKPDKLIHVFIFGVYVILQIRGFSRQDVFPFANKYAVALTILIAMLLSACTEFLQACCIPMRNGNVFDFIANTAGCAAGWAVYFFSLKKS